MSGVNNVILFKKKKKLKIYVYIFVIIIERNLTSILNLTEKLKIQLAKRKKNTADSTVFAFWASSGQC